MITKIIAFIAIGLACACNKGNAQLQGQVLSGKVNDVKGNPVADVIIMLNLLADSSLVKTSISAAVQELCFHILALL